MPLHLPPLPDSGRRTFLRNTAFAAGAVCLNPGTAHAAGEEMERWALLSDTHIDADPGKMSRQGVNMADNLRRVLSEVLAERDALDGVMIDGDCAYDEGLRGDYDTLAGLLAPVREAGLPIHLTLGNHDDRGPFYEAFADHRPDAPPVDGKHVSVVEGRTASWIFLDSLRFVNKVEGEFGEAQLSWLERHLQSRDGKPVILIGHHYPQVFRDDIIPGDGKIKISGLVDSEPFLGLVNRFAQVKAYLYGHSHDWKTTPGHAGLHQVNLPPTAYVFNAARPNGWVRATVDGRGMTLELRALDRSHPEHGQPVRLDWR